MITTAYVKIWGEVAGAIAWDAAKGIGSFEYSSAFLAKRLDLAPVKMPLEEAEGRIFTFPELKNINTFKGLPGLLADVLPDKYGNALINVWLTRQGRPTDSLNPVEVLCFIGKRGMGAMEFEPAYQETEKNPTKKIEIDSMVEMAEGILSGRQSFYANLKEDEEQALRDILRIGTSAGGARAKAIIAFNPETKEILSGQAEVPDGFSHWLIKFDGVHDAQFGASSGYGRVEMAYHLMAVDAGIEMTPCQLLEEHGRAHFMTRRFDRTPDNQKYHVQSFCALLHFDFNEVNAFSYEQLFETMRILGLPYPEAEQLYRRMVFNVMSRNCDDHTKNFAFIMNPEGAWKLSPAFDVCHAYRPDSIWVSQHALSINGKRKNINKIDLLEVGKSMNIKKAKDIINDVAAVISNWEKYADVVKVESKLKKAILQTLIIV